MLKPLSLGTRAITLRILKLRRGPIGQLPASVIEVMSPPMVSKHI